MSLYCLKLWLQKQTRVLFFSLLFQCRYTATAVHSLVVELIPGTSPLPVASTGPVRVHMQLANGRCATKGCNEGMSLLAFPLAVLAFANNFYAIYDLDFHSECSLHFFLCIERLPSGKTSEGTYIRSSWTFGKDWPTCSPDTWSLLDNYKPPPSHLSSVGHFDQRVTNVIAIALFERLFTQSSSTNLSSMQVSKSWWPLHGRTGSYELRCVIPRSLQALLLLHVCLRGRRFTGTYAPTGYWWPIIVPQNVLHSSTYVLFSLPAVPSLQYITVSRCTRQLLWTELLQKAQKWELTFSDLVIIM